MNGSKDYVIEGIKQLVDINGNMKNFVTQFSVKTENPTDKLQVSLVTQKHLDEGNEIKYNEIVGGIEDTIVINNPEGDGYYLVVKGQSDNPVKCVISFNTTQQQQSPPPPQQEPGAPPPQQEHQQLSPSVSDDRLIDNDVSVEETFTQKANKFYEENKTYIIIGVIGLMLGLFYLWNNGTLNPYIEKVPFLAVFLKTEANPSLPEPQAVSPPPPTPPPSAPIVEDVIPPVFEESIPSTPPATFGINEDIFINTVELNNQSSFIEELRSLDV